MDFSEGVDYHFPYFGLRVGQTIPTLSGGSYSHNFYLVYCLNDYMYLSYHIGSLITSHCFLQKKKIAKEVLIFHSSSTVFNKFALLDFITRDVHGEFSHLFTFPVETNG